MNSTTLIRSYSPVAISHLGRVAPAERRAMLDRAHYLLGRAAEQRMWTYAEGARHMRRRLMNTLRECERIRRDIEHGYLSFRASRWGSEPPRWRGDAEHSRDGAW